jgi:uncharacterized protein (DUF1800 family)
MPFNRLASCPDTTPPLGPDSYCARDNYTLFRVQLDFFRQALSAPDQLRQRVAFALSQIMVTSGVRNARAYPMRDYQQLLRDRAFGRFGELLRAVTVSPLMGEYLDMANNDKVDPASGTDPNENYAREVLQLFTVGTFLLNRDGSHKVDADGRPLFTYGESEIKGFARVFTGWTYPVAPGAQPRNHNPREFVGEMIPVEANHESGAKLLLRRTLAPAGMGAVRDLDFALANVVSHPNVGPFIGRQLIQRLVTSDPSPEYVGRVAAVFDDNGAGERGDLRAVVRAILLDPEARGARKIDPGYGKLSEPVLYMTSLARAAGARTDGVFLRAWSSQLGQSLFYAPSVFNYYPADYLVPGSGLPGPEFGALNSATANARLNFANNLIFAAEIAPDPTLDGAIGTVRDFSPYVALASDPDKLAGMLDRTLLAGTMPPPAARADRVVASRPAGGQCARARAHGALARGRVAVVPGAAMRGRRVFLQRALALGAGGLASRLVPLPLLSLAAPAVAQAGDYKALVCVFLYGGVDGNSLVVPLDSSGYGQYATVRPAASRVKIEQSSLLPIEPAASAVPYGMNPALAAVHPLFAQRRLAILANVGPLRAPTTRSNYVAVRPDNFVLACGPGEPVAIVGLLGRERRRMGRAHGRPARAGERRLPGSDFDRRREPFPQWEGVESARPALDGRPADGLDHRGPARRDARLARRPGHERLRTCGDGNVRANACVVRARAADPRLDLLRRAAFLCRPGKLDRAAAPAGREAHRGARRDGRAPPGVLRVHERLRHAHE